MQPWTQRISLAWPKTLAFFERRLDILRAIEGDGLLRSFEMQEDEVVVRLGDSSHILRFSDDGMQLRLLQPNSEIKRAEAALALVLDTLKPTRLLVPGTTFQWLVPIDLGYDEARVAAAAKLLGSESKATATDFALYLDGKVPSPPAEYHLECGIVDAVEAPFRLAGRRAPPQEGDVSPRTWPIESLPKVAFFCDSNWKIEGSVRHSTRAVMEIWDKTRETAAHMVASIADRLGVSVE